MYIATYRGVKIVENYGFYSPAIDRTVETTSFSKVIDWINKKTGFVPPKQVVDMYVIGDYVMQSKTLLN